MFIVMYLFLISITHLIHINSGGNCFHTSSTSGLEGAVGEDTFEFFALKLGKTKITFSYLRLWLKEKESTIRKKIFKVIIE